MNNIVALFSDFGPKGQHYVASMKGVILKIAGPNIKIIDISHNISPFSIVEASYLIRNTYKHFPENTIFIIVVDPGVGSKREILIIKTKSKHYFIGPNNGIFSQILKLKNIIECINVKNTKYFNNPVSSTFHGRDIMAPVGAYITKGISLKEFGNRFDIKDIIEHRIKYKINLQNKKVECVIQYIDSYGNGVTNIPIRNNFIKNTSLFFKEDSIINIEFNDVVYEGKFVSHFESVPINSLIFLKGSTGYLELSKNQGNVAKDLSFKVGDIITISL